MPLMIIDLFRRVFVTATGSLALPSIMVRFSWGAERDDRRAVSLDGVRTTRSVLAR